MTFEELKTKALSLPLLPGVYLMRDSHDHVIYVGKAKKLRNRVSQYFQDTASHSPKTRLMVSKINHFEVIVASSEFEALVLECSLIKRYLPKYNILLKDDKGYPYLRLNLKEEYPRITIVSETQNDGALYYGPFGTRGTTQSVLKALESTFKLPTCSRQFPRDIGKQRPCLSYHMHECEGWCREECSQSQYRSVIMQAKQLLGGNYHSLTEELRVEMLNASERLEFELAAKIRDRMIAVEALGKKQLVTSGTLADTDVIGYGEAGVNACFAVLHYAGGNLLDKEYEIFPIPEIREAALSSLIKQYYLSRRSVPKIVLLPFEMEDGPLFSQLVEQEYGKKVKFKVPQRGDNVRLIEMAIKNAEEEAKRITSREEHIAASLMTLGKMLSIDPPKRIEAFDISNISGTDIVASMVVFKNGKPKKSDYRHFKVENMEDQDDYASMHQVVQRRFHNLIQKEKGFDEAPDLLLIDGGINHASIVERMLQGIGISLPVFGMVKDDRHRTRALVSPDGMEIAIDGQQAVFSLIGNIQEEAHRFAIGYHRKLRSNRLRYSELDQIAGIGPKRKQELLKRFRSLSAIRDASLQELEAVLPQSAALALYQYFHKE